MPVELPKGLWFELKEPPEHLIHQQNTPSSSSAAAAISAQGVKKCYICADERVDSLQLVLARCTDFGTPQQTVLQ